MTRLITTFFYIGLLRPAPGTWGSLAAIPAAWALHALGGFFGLLIGTIVVAGLGWWATNVEIAGAEDQDPGEIVIDEVLGMFLALWPVSYGSMMAGAGLFNLWPGVLVAFLAFRFFDIVKPGPVGWADRQTGAMGVMADDAIAGGLASLIVVVAAVLYHGVLL
jgi:phosphatidylglycerophosphatase A